MTWSESGVGNYESAYRDISILHGFSNASVDQGFICILHLMIVNLIQTGFTNIIYPNEEFKMKGREIA